MLNTVIICMINFICHVIKWIYRRRAIFFLFYKPDYTLNEDLESFNAEAVITEKSVTVEKMDIKVNHIGLLSPLSLSISVITLAITLIIFIPAEFLNSVNILAYKKKFFI